MNVTAVDFEKYIHLAKNEEISISDGKQGIIMLVPVTNENHPVTSSLIGAFKKCNNIDINVVRDERFEKKYKNIDWYQFNFGYIAWMTTFFE